MSSRAGWKAALAQVLLDGALLAVLSLPLVALFLGGPAGIVLQALLFAAYAGFFRHRRAAATMVAAVLLAAALSGVFFVLTGSRGAGPSGPPPNPAMAAVLRSSLMDYRLKHKGAYPSRLEDLMPEYLAMAPVFQAGRHAPGNDVEFYGPEVCGKDGPEPSAMRDTGKWGYVNDPRAPCWGLVFIDCVHLDGEGKPFYGY